MMKMFVILSSMQCSSTGIDIFNGAAKTALIRHCMSLSQMGFHKIAILVLNA